MLKFGVAILMLLTATSGLTTQAPAPQQAPAPVMPGPTCSQVPQAQLDANKRVVMKFFSREIAALNREEKSAQTQTDDYIQHNPRFLRMNEITGAAGREAWVKAGEEAGKRGITLVPPGVRLANPVMIMAECDLVTAIYKGVLPDPDDPSKTYEAFAFETFRVRDGKVSEHWDQVRLEQGWMKGTAK